MVTSVELAGLTHVHSGKVRDMYAIPGHDELLLMVASDRISAYDVIMDAPIPGKGAVLTALSLFWFEQLGDIVENHLVTARVEEYPEICHQHKAYLQGRSMLVKKSRPLPVECIVRGYLSGSFWQAYQQDTNVCGFQLPAGLRESDKLPEILFTPSTKAALGEHDENISLAQLEDIVGRQRANEIAEITIALYHRAADYAKEKGIIIADTKIELGEIDGRLILIDEVLTPDSSRFWPADQYQPGRSQASFDKQFLRDYLAALDWDKQPPAPVLPAEVLEKTKNRYQEAVERICGWKMGE